PNDLYNNFQRHIVTGAGELTLTSPAARDEVLTLASTWANVADRIGVIGVYGSDSLAISRSATRRGGQFQSLCVDELCWPCMQTTRAWDAGSTLLDAGWVVLSDVNAQKTRQVAESGDVRPLNLPQPDVRGIALT